MAGRSEETLVILPHLAGLCGAKEKINVLHHGVTGVYFPLLMMDNDR